MKDAQYVPVDVVDSQGNHYTMYDVQYSTTRKVWTGMKWYVCQICGFSYPQDKVRIRGDQAFCIPNRCYQEMYTNEKEGKK